MFGSRKVTVRHWRYGYKHEHVGRDMRSALRACLDCVDRSVSAMRFDAMVDNLNEQGWATFDTPGHATETYRVVR